MRSFQHSDKYRIIAVIGTTLYLIRNFPWFKHVHAFRSPGFLQYLVLILVWAKLRMNLTSEAAWTDERPLRNCLILLIVLNLTFPRPGA